MNPDEKYAKWNAILDDLYARVEEIKRNIPAPNKLAEIEIEISQPVEPDNKFDFEKMAFERLKARIGDSKITLKEYYRLMGAWYSLKKIESRQLLYSLKCRFELQSNNRFVWKIES